MADDIYNKKWIIENSVKVCSRYDDGVLTLRALYYQLVSLGMTNSIRHYKRVCSNMAIARREGTIRYSQFSDQDRGMSALTEWSPTDYDDKVSEGKNQVGLWMKSYRLNRWENQEYYVEVWIEKKALIGVFKPVCDEHKVGLAACKGYPSLTFLNEASFRFRRAQREDKKTIILYFGDYDPTGEDIPRSLEENLRKDFGTRVEVSRIALMEDQVVEMGLPPAPTKETDSRSAAWDGIGQVELDAIPPEDLKELIDESILELFDEDKHEELRERQAEERSNYIDELREFVEGMEFDDEDDE